MLRNISWNMLARLAGVLLGFPETILVAHLLGPQGQGMYKLALLIPSLLGLVTNLGINLANVYYVGQDARNARTAVANSLWSGLILGTLAALVYLPFAVPIHNRFLAESPYYYELIGVVLLPVSLINYYLAHIFTGLKELKPPSIWTVCMAIMTLSGAAFVGLLTPASGSEPVPNVIEERVGGMVVLYALVIPVSSTAVYLWLLGRRGLLSLRGDFAQWRRSVTYGIRGYIANLFQFLNFRLDSIILAAYLGATEVGIYSLAVLLSEFLWMIGNSVAMILFPTTAGQTEHQANSLTARACRQVTWITLAEAVVLGASAWWLVPFIFGERFRPSVAPLWLLLPGTVALIIPNVLTAHLAGRGRPQIGTLAAGVSLVATVALDLLLIPRLGVAGAALASSAAYTLTALVVLTVFRQVTGLPWAAVVIPRAEDWRDMLALVARGRRYLGRRLAGLRPEV